MTWRATNLSVTDVLDGITRRTGLQWEIDDFAIILSPVPPGIPPETYLYTDHWFWGKRLALGGYSLPKVRKGKIPLPLTWTGDDSFTVEFATGRQQAKPVRMPPWVEFPDPSGL